MSGGTQARVEVARLNARISGLHILRDVGFAVAPGEFFAVFGANGAGKTTLLRTVAGSISPTSGEVFLDGVATREPAHKRARAGLAFIGDDRQIFPHLTVEQTLRLVRKPRADPLEIFPELAPLNRRRVGLLSGGEQQMLALARALSGRPRIVVVDELSQGLAPMIRGRLLDQLRKTADEGATVIVVEQSAEPALSVADRAGVLRRGELVAVEDASYWRREPDRLAALYLR